MITKPNIASTTKSRKSGTTASQKNCHTTARPTIKRRTASSSCQKALPRANDRALFCIRVIRAEKSLFLKRTDTGKPARSKVLYLCVLTKGQHPRPLLANRICVDDDGLLLVLGCSVDLGTVAALGLVAAGLVEQLPVLLTEVVHKGVQLVRAALRIFFLEVKQQLERVRLDEELPHELVLPRLPRDENRAVEVPSRGNQQPHYALQVSLLNRLLVTS
jgi:hypothetical protein